MPAPDTPGEDTAGIGIGDANRRAAVALLIGQCCDDEAIARCLNLTSNGTAIRCDDGRPWTPARVRSYRRGAGL
ncbi:MAG: hypothetical protein F4147_12255 [Gammaproteobacteria bacterium]|nr:hypothetical protein [Gammaproteobacteria bacterium]